ncbi:LD-carboxypeptidase LdcB/DacB [Streptococcus orisratti]
MKKDIFAQEKQRFSIRKYSFGAASVLIGASLVFAGQVAADETGTAKSNSTEPVTVQVSTPSTESSTADQTATSETTVAQADHAETTVKAVEAAVGTATNSTVSSDSSASAKAEVTTSTDTVTDTASTSGAVSEVSTSQVDSSVATEKTTSEDTEVSSDAGLDAAKITVSNSAQTNVAVEDLLREAKVATTASVSEDRAAVAEKKLPTTGYYTYPERTEVKNTPTVAAPVEFYVNAGDRVFYDKVLTNDGYQWLSYKSYSGIRRYAAITKLTADKPVAAPTGQLSFQNQTPQGFDVLVTNVSDSNGIAAVKVPVWTDKSGQDDLIWYNAAKQANGDYKVAVKVSDHKNELGDYNVHLYYIESTGKMVGVTGTKTTVTNEVPQSGLNLPSQGSYTFTSRVEVKSQPKMSAPTEFTFDKGEKINYDKVLDADSHQWISYVSYSGTRRYIPIALSAQPVKPAIERTGKLTIDSQSNGDFNVVVSEVSDPNGIAEVKVPVWTDKSGQDDLVWYDAAKQSDGTYKVAVKLSDHKNERGIYNVHLYYIDKTGSKHGVTATQTTVAQPKDERTGTLSIQNQSNGDFNVIVSNVSDSNGIAEVKVPVWTDKSGQDDLVWYDAAKQSDGTYKATVKLSDHKNERGTYNVHLYYIDKTGSKHGVTATQTTVAQPKDERTGTLSIQNQSNGDFNVIVSNVSDSNGIAEVKVPVWTDKSGQDDLVWYDAAKQSDGTYKVAVKLSDHKNERGIYNVHLYYIDKTGSKHGVTATQTTVAQPKDERTGTLSIQNQSNGDFNVIVSNVSDSNGIAEVKVPVWTDKSGQDDLVWYDAAKQSDGTYKVAVKLSDHKNERGTYNVHLYYIDKTGSKHGVTATQTTVAQPKDERTGTLSIQNQSNGDFNVIVSNVSDSNGIAEVKVPVWTDKSGQDDLVWYDATKQSDGTYKAAVKLSDHKNERGIYNVHLYYIDKTGKMSGVTATQTTVAQPVVEKNKLSIENKTSKGFDVIVSNLSFSTPVTQVKVPVWSSQSGQDDLVWYDAAKQSNGNYKVSVSVSNHKNSSGEYNVHLYYLDNTGKMYGIAGTTTTVETSNAEPVFNGSYYSIKGKYDDIIVVNKKYPLSATYNPGENASAKEAFTRLRNDMIAQGLNVGYGYSGFRSYSTQANLYQNYVNRDGQAAADRYSARPGYSEHQTGLAYDLTDKAGNLLEDARASQWLKDNAHNYGFVVRYQPGKEASTGFMEEAWHVRYIGKEAKEVHDSGLTLEEYFGFQGGDYGNVSPAQPSQPTNTGNNLPAQGTYTFTKNCPIKAEPNNASPIITYYPAGDKVNYTSVLNNDGHVWLTYRTYSGVQRYVAID